MFASFIVILTSQFFLCDNFLHAVELLLYSPKRPLVDYSVIFLWLMCVGTIVTASYWKTITVVEQNDEPYNELAEKVLTSD